MNSASDIGKIRDMIRDYIYLTDGYPDSFTDVVDRVIRQASPEEVRSYISGSQQLMGEKEYASKRDMILHIKNRADIELRIRKASETG